MAGRREALINQDQSTLTQNVQNGDYTLLPSDIGKLISKQSGGAGETYTIPANGSVASSASFDSDSFDLQAFDSAAFSLAAGVGSEGTPFRVGTMIAIDNTGGGDLYIAITNDTLTWSADGTTGTRVLADEGLCVLLKVGTTNWKISGDGLT